VLAIIFPYPYTELFYLFKYSVDDEAVATIVPAVSPDHVITWGPSNQDSGGKAMYELKMEVCPYVLWCVCVCVCCSVFCDSCFHVCKSICLCDSIIFYSHNIYFFSQNISKLFPPISNLNDIVASGDSNVMMSDDKNMMTQNDTTAEDHINWRFSFTVDNQVKLKVYDENLLVTVHQRGDCDHERRPNCDSLSCLVDTGCVLDVSLEEEIVNDNNDSQLFTVLPS